MRRLYTLAWLFALPSVVRSQCSDIIAVTTNWSGTAYYKYDNVSEAVQFQTRLRWIVRPGREFFLVVGQNLDVKPGDFRVRETQPTAKLRWTFRF